MAKTFNYRIYMGLNDKDEHKQIIPQEEVETVFNNLMERKRRLYAR